MVIWGLIAKLLEYRHLLLYIGIVYMNNYNIFYVLTVILYKYNTDFVTYIHLNKVFAIILIYAKFIYLWVDLNKNTKWYGTKKGFSVLPARRIQMKFEQSHVIYALFT